MPGENSNPNQYVKTIDQIIAERNSARAKGVADAAAARDKARKSNQLSNLVTQINEYRRLIILAERDLSITSANIQTARAAGNTAGVDTGLALYNTQKVTLDKLKDDEARVNTERRNIVAGLVAANKAVINASIKDSGITKPDTNKKQKKIKPATEDTPEPPAPQPFTGYVYNLPMIQSAYFRQDSPQGGSTERGVTGAGNYTDARNMFGESIAKGTIQMPLNLTNSAAWKFKTGIYKEDSTMYGFKFLYNPTEVNMGWGMLEGVDPNVIRSGAAGGLAPISGVGLSTIDFTLLLNRIGDMDFLDENGLAPGENNPYSGVNTLSRVEDLKTIYKKGTMYDLEYLFRVINGPNAIHQTILNGKSADWGFLIGSQIELFLGDGLRYLVRLNGINVSHTIFNDRMVPVLSQVSLSCGRYNDVGLKPEDNR
jgi:hypothetical protein